MSSQLPTPQSLNVQLDSTPEPGAATQSQQRAPPNTGSSGAANLATSPFSLRSPLDVVTSTFAPQDFIGPNVLPLRSRLLAINHSTDASIRSLNLRDLRNLSANLAPFAAAAVSSTTSEGGVVVPSVRMYIHARSTNSGAVTVHALIRPSGAAPPTNHETFVSRPGSTMITLGTLIIAGTSAPSGGGSGSHILNQPRLALPGPLEGYFDLPFPHGTTPILKPAPTVGTDPVLDYMVYVAGAPVFDVYIHTSVTRAGLGYGIWA